MQKKRSQTRILQSSVKTNGALSSKTNIPVGDLKEKEQSHSSISRSLKSHIVAKMMQSIRFPRLFANRVGLVMPNRPIGSFPFRWANWSVDRTFQTTSYRTWFCWQYDTLDMSEYTENACIKLVGALLRLCWLRWGWAINWKSSPQSIFSHPSDEVENSSWCHACSSRSWTMVVWRMGRTYR